MLVLTKIEFFNTYIKEMILIIQHTKSGEPATVIKYENKEDMRIKLCNHLVKSQINSANLYFNNLVGKHVNRHVFVDVGRYMDYPDRFLLLLMRIIIHIEYSQKPILICWKNKFICML